MRHSKVADIEVPDPPSICIRYWHASFVITLGIEFYRNWYAEAIRLYTEAIAGASTDAELFANRSIAHLAAGNRQEALEDASQATNLRPEWAKAQYRWVYAHAQGSWMRVLAIHFCANIVSACSLADAVLREARSKAYSKCLYSGIQAWRGISGTL